MNTRDKLFEVLSRQATSSDERARAMDDLHRRLAALSFAGGECTVERFLERAREAGSTAFRCATPEEATVRITGILSPGTRCVLAVDPLLGRMRIAEALEQVGVEVLSVREPKLAQEPKFAQEHPGARGTYAATDAGLTVALAGLADSGAIVISSSESESRSVSLLPMRHVAVLPAGRILSSLHEAAALLRTLVTGASEGSAPAASAEYRGGSSAVTLVGGPSKTADIEKVLVTGVHGPGALTIVVIDEEGRG